MSNLGTYKAICDTNIKPCPPPKIWSQDHESKSRKIFRQNKILFDTCIGFFSSFTSVTTPSPVPLSSCFHPFQWLFWKDPLAQHLNNRPTALKSHKSRTLLVHHLIPFYFTVSRPVATNPRSKHQALAPSSPISLRSKFMFVTVLLTFNASARACGQKRCQTKPCQTWELTKRSATLT